MSNRIPSWAKVARRTKFCFQDVRSRPDSGVDLARGTQPGRDLVHAWIISDHVKGVAEWTTMAYQVYNRTYQRVMTTVCYKFWYNLNHIMAMHGISKSHFKRFMADNAQASWNAVRIFYWSRDPKVPIDGR